MKFGKSINFFFLNYTFCILRNPVYTEKLGGVKFYFKKDLIKILEENTGNTLFELGHSNFLQDTSMKARETKAKMNYWDLIKIFLRFCSYFLILVFSVLNQSIVEFANSFFC